MSAMRILRRLEPSRDEEHARCTVAGAETPGALTGAKFGSLLTPSQYMDGIVLMRTTGLMGAGEEVQFAQEETIGFDALDELLKSAEFKEYLEGAIERDESVFYNGDGIDGATLWQGLTPSVAGDDNDVKTIRIRGGADVQGNNIGPAGAPMVYLPGDTVPDADQLLSDNKTPPQLIGVAFRMYDHCHGDPLPNIYTKKGNMRALHTTHGVFSKITNFLEAETDPNRVPPRCYYRARGQDILTLAREQFGDGATVDTMFAILKERKEASLEDSDPDEVD